MCAIIRREPFMIKRKCVRTRRGPLVIRRVSAATRRWPVVIRKEPLMIRKEMLPHAISKWIKKDPDQFDRIILWNSS